MNVNVNGGEFGARLRARREAARLSQQELADRSGLSIRAIRNIERGRTQWPYRNSLTRLADALGMREAGRAEFLAAVPRRQLARLVLEAGSALPGAGLGTAGAADQAPAPPAPRQLPAAVGCFTGRAAELAALTGLLDRRSGAATHTLVISAIGGTAGVGKTALAVAWAHRVAGRFPDGQLYVNLRGFDPDQPVAAAEALAGFLRALGVHGQDIPDAIAFRSIRAAP
jgi:transcriptional regulator with XRE-family HTH domain